MADEEDRSFSPGASEADRSRGPGAGRTGPDQQGDLGAGTPANVDIHKLGQADNPEEDWGESAGEGAMHSSTNSNRGGRTELERGQGAKTRAFNKDQMSRRT